MVLGIGRVVDAGGSTGEKLARLWAFFADVRERQPDYFQLFAYLAQPEATAGASPELRAEIARRSAEPFRRIAQLFAEQSGPEDARLRADLFWAACVGLVVLRDARHNLKLGARTHPNDAEFRRCLQLVLDGIAARPKPTRRDKTRGGRR